MNFQLILFYLLAAIILFGALKTVTVKNPVHAALYLVLTFCMSAMMWMLMQAEFLGITLASRKRMTGRKPGWILSATSVER